MGAYVSPHLMKLARRNFKNSMIDTATILRTGVQVPALVIIQRWAVPLHGVMADRVRERKWEIKLPASSPASNPDPLWNGTTIQEGDRISITRHGVFMVLELSAPDTYAVATTAMCVAANGKVSFSRPGANGAVIPEADVYVSRVNDEIRSYGVNYEWEVWFDSSLRYPAGTYGGTLISKDDEMEWNRAPNPFPNGGTAIIDKPRYEYGAAGGAIVSAYFKESI